MLSRNSNNLGQVLPGLCEFACGEPRDGVTFGSVQNVLMYWRRRLTAAFPAALAAWEVHRRIRPWVSALEEERDPEDDERRVASFAEILIDHVGASQAIKESVGPARGLAAVASEITACLCSWEQIDYPILQQCLVHRGPDDRLLLSHALSQPVCNPPAYKTGRFEKAHGIAQQYKSELMLLRELLRSMHVQLPEDRFGGNNAELMRFAFPMGLCSAHTIGQRQDALEKTAERIAEAVVWLREQRFLSEEQLQRWQETLHWNDPERDEHPLLVIRLGRATRECTGEELNEFADAIISQVHYALRTRLSDEAGCPEQMVVVAECSGASTLQASHVLKLIKRVSLTLNRYYPGRMHRFYLVDLPRMLRWPVKAIIALGHPTTRAKVVLCDADDPRLPQGFRKL